MLFVNSDKVVGVCTSYLLKGEKLVKIWKQGQ